MTFPKRRAAAPPPAKLHEEHGNSHSRDRSSSPSKPGKFSSIILPTSYVTWNLVGLLLNVVVLSVTLLVYKWNLASLVDICHGKTSDSLQHPHQVTSHDSLEQTDNYAGFHIIFSTGCSDRQDFQAYVLFHSILESGQTGHATRIASGCTTTQAATLVATFQAQIKTMDSDRFHLHLTPEFGKVKNDKSGKTDTFHYLNKPFGVAHWMEEALGYSTTNPRTKHDETIVVLLDPDMILVRPFVNDFQGEEVWRDRTTYPHITRVKHGFPMAQEYGYGLAWFAGVNIQDVIPTKHSPVQNMTRKQLVENYTAGPPYLATGRNFYEIAAMWRELSLPVLKLFPDNILAEMYAYSWASAHLNLPHQMAHSFMVSNFYESGFQLFDRNQYTSEQMCRGIPKSSRPHVLHYCQRYTLGKYILGKHRLPIGFVGHENPSKVCASPLLAEPPNDLATLYDYYIEPDSKYRYNITDSKHGEFTKQEHIDRTTYILCEEADSLNRAALYYKHQHCDRSTMNTAKTLIFHHSLEITEEEKRNYEPSK